MKTKVELDKEKELRRLKRQHARKARQVFYKVDTVELKRSMRRSTLTQTQIAKSVGIHLNFISAFCCGRMNPSKDELIKLCAKLKITQRSISARRVEVLL